MAYFAHARHGVYKCVASNEYGASECGAEIGPAGMCEIYGSGAWVGRGRRSV
jgi:hypothetical protein